MGGNNKGWSTFILIVLIGIFLGVAGSVFILLRAPRAIVIGDGGSAMSIASSTVNQPPARPPLDLAAYNAKLLEIANLPPPIVVRIPSSTATTTAEPWPASLWPVKTTYPDGGPLLPFNRIVAYYGNYYSTAMGVLGEYPVPQMLAMLASTTAEWAAADSSTPVIPGIDYIAVAAQGSPGADGKYRLRMPASQIDQAIAEANQENGVVILDIQLGLSNVQTEIPLLEPYLKVPNVELALDPEFAMHNGAKPGTVIGSLDASDINYTAEYLASIVRQNNLPPKVLIIHRFTQPMVTNSADIAPLPEVQIVMDMDGFGSPAEKLTTYHDFIESEPVQFTGFKLFYKNDISYGGHLMTPSEVLKLTPQPSFIQYQ